MEELTYHMEPTRQRKEQSAHLSREAKTLSNEHEKGIDARIWRTKTPLRNS